MYERATRESPVRGAVDAVVLPSARCELELNKGNLALADRLATRAIEAASRFASALDPITADAHFVRGTVLVERNQLAGAEEELVLAMQLGEESGYIHAWLGPALSLARAWHVVGRESQAWALLEEVRQHRGRPVPPPLTERIDAACARLALLDGDLEVARAHAALTDERRRVRLLARIHAEAGEPELALATIEEVDPRATWARLDVLLVRARCARGDEARAAALLDALRLAEPDQYVRIFVDEARWITDPLRELVASWPTSYIAQLVTALANEPARPVANMVTGALTEREIEVWRYLSTPLSTREIAEALFISRNTLKSHLRSIYRKLGVRTRHDAVARGQERLGRAVI